MTLRAENVAVWELDENGEVESLGSYTNWNEE